MIYIYNINTTVLQYMILLQYGLSYCLLACPNFVMIGIWPFALEQLIFLLRPRTTAPSEGARREAWFGKLSATLCQLIQIWLRCKSRSLQNLSANLEITRWIHIFNHKDLTFTKLRKHGQEVRHNSMNLHQNSHLRPWPSSHPCLTLFTGSNGSRAQKEVPDVNWATS